VRGFWLIDFVTTAPAPWFIASCRVVVVSPSMPAASMVGLRSCRPAISVSKGFGMFCLMCGLMVGLFKLGCWFRGGL